MGLIKTSVLSAMATSIKLISSFLINKVVAVYIGPSGIALIGQFQNFLSITMIFSNGSINQAVTKYIAEYNEQPDKQKELLVSSLKMVIICSSIIGVVIYCCSNKLSNYLLGSSQYSAIFKIFSVSIILSSLNTIIVSALNGYKEIKKITIINISSSIVGLLCITVMSYFYGLFGAIISIIFSQIFMFLISFFFVRNTKLIRFRNLINSTNYTELKKLLKFSTMAFASALGYQLSYFIIRKFIINEVSITSAGYWEAVWRISDLYLSIVITSLSIYYLPRLSEIKKQSDLKNEVIRGYKVILPIVLTSCFIIYFSRDLIIQVLFTKEFEEVRSLFLFQLIGDFLKVSSWLISYVLVAKALIKPVIITELLYSSMFTCFSIFFINIFGLVGVTYAFALSYFLYLLMVLWVYKSQFPLNKDGGKYEKGSNFTIKSNFT